MAIFSIARVLYMQIKLFRKFIPEFLETAHIKLISDALHKAVVKIKVVDCPKAHGQYLPCLEEMPDIGPRKIAANRAVAMGVNGSIVLGILCVIYIDNSVPSEKVAVPSIS